MEACERLGYEIDELVYKNEHDVKISSGDVNIRDEVLKMRWKAYETARKQKVKNVMDERRKVVSESKGFNKLRYVKSKYLFKCNLNLFVTNRNSATFLTILEKKSSPIRGVPKKLNLNNSIIEKELDDLVDNDEEIRLHKLEIQKIKHEHQKQLQRFLKKEIGKLVTHLLILPFYLDFLTILTFCRK